MGNCLQCAEHKSREQVVVGRRQPSPSDSATKATIKAEADDELQAQLLLDALDDDSSDDDDGYPKLQVASHVLNSGLNAVGTPWDHHLLGAPVAPNEEYRLLTYRAMGLQDTAPCPELDTLLSALCTIMSAPIASLALYTDGRCWLTNTVQMPQGELVWNLAACPWNLLVAQPQTLVCGDLQQDARFSNQPWTLGGLRCYCSAPLLASNGHRLGTVCFMDTVPREVDAGMCRVLNNFGELAVRVLERHVGLAQKLRAARLALPRHLELLSSLAASHDPSALDLMQGQLQPPGPEFGYWKPTPFPSRLSSCASSTPRAKPAPLPAPDDSQLAREVTFALTQPSPASSMSHPASNLSQLPPPPPRLPPLLQQGNSHCPGTSSESCLNTSSEATTSLASRPPVCSQGHSSAASAPAVKVAPSIDSSPSPTTTPTTITHGPAQLPASSKRGDTQHSLSSPQPSSVQPGQQAGTQAQPTGQLPSPSLVGEPDQAASRLAAKAAAAPPTTHSQPSPPPPAPLAIPPGPASAPEGGLASASAPAPASASPTPLQAANPLQGTVNNSPLGSLSVAAPLVEVLRGHRGCGTRWHSPFSLTSASSSSKRSNLGPSTASQPPKDTAEKAVTDVVVEAGGKEGAGEVPEDMLVMNAFWRQLRSQESTFEACVLLVDTAKPGWPVVFADDTWRLWAGFGRDAIVGQPLASCVAPAAPTAAPPAWAALQAEAQKGRRFLIPSMVATPVGPAAAFADITTVRKGNGQPGATSTPHDLDQGPRLQGQGAEQVHPQRLRAESAPAPTVLQQAAGVAPSSTAAAGVPDAGGAAVKAGQGLDVPSAGYQQQAAPAPCGVDIRPGGTRRGSSLEGPPGRLPQASPLVVPLATANLRPIPPCTTDLLHSELRDALEASLQQQQEQKRREAAQPLGSANSSMSKRQQLQARSKGSKGQGAGLEGRRSGASGQSGGTSQHRLTIQGFPTSITYTPSAAQARGSSRVFDMSFRPAALDLLDADTLPLGMPSFVPMTVNSLVAGLYAVRLHNPARLALPSRVLKPSAKVTALQDAVPVKLAPQYFPGLVLTQVLGAGGYGTAYHGVWHDAEVVLKVQDLTLRTPQQLEEAQLEVCLGQLLQHPNLVRSLAHGAAQLPLKPDAPPTVLASTDTELPSQLETEKATPLETGAPAIAAVGAKGSGEGKPACMSRAAARPTGSSGSKAAGGRGDRLQQQAVAGRGAGLLGRKPQKPSSPDWFAWELGSSSSGSEDSRSGSGSGGDADRTEQEEEEEEEEEESGDFNEHEDPAYWFSKYAAGVPHLPRLLSSMSSAQGSHQPSSSSHTQSAWTSSLLGTEHHGSTSSARLHSQGCSLNTADTHSSSSAARQQPQPPPQPQPTAQLTGTTDPHRGMAGPQAHPSTPTGSVAQQGTGMGTTPAQPNPAPRPVLKLDPEPSEHPPTAVGLAQHVQPGGNEQSADANASPQPDVSASLPPTAEGSVVASSNMSSIPTWTTYVPTAAHPVPSPSLVEPSSHAAPDPAPHPPTPHPPSPHPPSQQATGLAPGTSTSQPPTPSSAAAPSTSDPIEAPSAVGGAHSSLLPKSSARAVQAATAISASSIDSSALQQRLTPPWSLAQSLGINSFASDKKGRGQEEGLSGARGPWAAAQASTFAKLVATWRGAGKQGLGPPSTLSPKLDATLAAAPAGPGKGTPTHAPDPAGKQAQPAAPAMGLGQAGQGQARHVAVQQTGQNAAGAVAQPTQGQGGARRASQKPMHMAEELAALRRLTESVEFPGGLGRQAVPLSSSVNSRGSPGARVDLASQDLQLPARLRIFMLMEFCDAGSLQDAVDRGWLRVEHGNARTPLHAARSMAVITDIACGLGYLHARGVVHADLSASNILLCKRAPCMLSSRPESVTSGLGRLPAAAVPKPGGVADTAPKSGGSGVAAATGSALDTAAAEGETTCETGTWAGAGALVLGAMPHAPTTTDRAPATAEHARPAGAAAPRGATCLPDPSAIAAAALPPPAGAADAPVPQQALAAMRTQAAAGPGPGPGLITQTATLSHQGSLAGPSTPVVAQGVVAITLPRAKSGKPSQPARLASTAPLEAAAANEESKGISLLPPAQRYVVTDAGQVESTEVQYVAKISDFGKSRVLNPEGVIEVGSYATVTHMAPEVLRDRRLSPAADVYSFGVLCWQIITGLRPWGGMSHRQIFGLVSSGQGRLKWPQLPPSLPDRGLWVALQALATACMAPDVSARPSMRVVRKHLKLLTAKYVGEK